MEYKYKRETVLTEYFDLETETAEAALRAIENGTVRPVCMEKDVSIKVVRLRSQNSSGMPEIITKLFTINNETSEN